MKKQRLYKHLFVCEKDQRFLFWKYKKKFNIIIHTTSETPTEDIINHIENIYTGSVVVYGKRLDK